MLSYICIAQSKYFIFTDGLSHIEEGVVSMGHFA